MSGRKHSHATVPEDIAKALGATLVATATVAGYVTIKTVEGTVSTVKAINSQVEKRRFEASINKSQMKMAELKKMMKEFKNDCSFLHEIENVRRSIEQCRCIDDARQVSSELLEIEQKVSETIARDYDQQEREYRRVSALVDCFPDATRREVDPSGYRKTQSNKKKVASEIAKGNVVQAAKNMAAAIGEMLHHSNAVEEGFAQKSSAIQAGMEGIVFVTRENPLIEKWAADTARQQQEIADEIKRALKDKNLQTAHSLLNKAEALHHQSDAFAREQEQHELEQAYIAEAIAEGLSEMGLVTERYSEDGHQCVKGRTATGNSMIASVKDSIITYDLENFRYSDQLPEHARSAEEFLNHAGDIIYAQRQLDIGELQWERPDVDVSKIAKKLPRQKNRRTA